MNKNAFTYRPRRAGSVVRWGLWLCMCMSFLSCKKNFTLGGFEDDKLVVLAEIIAADSVKIPVGKTIKAGGGAIIRFEKVNDATVTMTENTAAPWTLQPSWSPLFASNSTTVYTTRRKFKYNTNYSIEIKHPSLGTIKATTHIPLQPHITFVDTASARIQDKDVLGVTFSWQDAADKEDFYVIEAVKEIVKLGRFFYYKGVKYDYDIPANKTMFEQVKNIPGVQLLRDTVPQNKFIRLYLYTQDNNTENAKIDKLTDPFRRIFYTDHAINGQTYITKVYVDKQFFVSSDPKEKGRVRLQFKSVSRELYDYLLTYEKYKTDFGTVPTNQLTTPGGNIQNGLGIFGSSARRERIFYFDVLL